MMGEMIEIELNGVRQMADESTLRKVECPRVENDNEIATAQEWYLGDTLVKRDAQVQLKKWPEGMGAFVGDVR